MSEAQAIAEQLIQDAVIDLAEDFLGITERIDDMDDPPASLAGRDALAEKVQELVESAKVAVTW